MKKLLILLTITLLLNIESFGFAFRVNQLPNGTRFACSNCHLSAGGGGPLTSFGEQVANIGLSGSNVDWSRLWDQDADGDGATNGEELGDPNGEWQVGDEDPGDPSLVTRPWDDTDFPTSVNSDNYFTEVIASPNPFQNKLSISTFLKQNGFVKVAVFNINGNEINTISNFFETIGEKTYVWDAKDKNGNFVPKGVYFIQIIQDNAFKTLQVILE